MKRPTVCLFAIVACASCTTSPLLKSAISLEDYKKLASAPPLKAKMFQVRCKLVEADHSVDFGGQGFVIKAGESLKFQVIREYRFPTAFHLAEPSKSVKEGGYPIVPSTPTSFEQRNVGTELTLTVETRGPFVEVAGTLSESQFNGFGRAGGEAFAPISDAKKRLLYTENRVSLPQFTTVETMIRACGVPGKDLRVQISGEKREMVIRCEVAP